VSPVLLEEKDNYQVTVPAAWSHDGRSIYHVRNDRKGQTSEIILRNLETNQERKIAGLTEKNVFFTLLSISPDGSSLAALILDENTKSKLLTVLPAEGGELRTRLELKGREGFSGPSGFAWSPDSRQILFLKKITREQSTQGQSELWRLSAETGEPQKLGDLTNGVEISLHADGQSLTFGTGVYKSEIWVMENFLPADNAQGKDKRQRE
ncbi:MAG: hypothetical protein MUQ25_15115, partial [Candidatus Aminicenantes bacterium]|nr:hypothetical protein [Candidatus Aminicenantes bacterium]